MRPFWPGFPASRVRSCTADPSASLDEELAFHLEMQTRKEMERGRSADEAREPPAGGSAASTRPRTPTAINAVCRGSTR